MKATGEYMRAVPVRTNHVLLGAGIDMALTLLAMFLSSEIRLALPFGKDLNEPTVRVNWVVYALTAMIWLAAFAQFGLYTRRWVRLRDEWGTVTLAVLVALFILAGILYMTFRQISRLQFVYFGALDLILLIAVRAVRTRMESWRAAAKDRDLWRILIAGSGPAGRSLAAQLVAAGGRPSGIQVVGFLDDDATKQNQVIDGLCVIGTLDMAIEVIQRERICEIVLALPRDNYSRMLALITELERLPASVQVSLVPDVLDLSWFHTRVDDVNGVPLLRLHESPLNGPARTVKRLMDIVLSSLLLICAAPAMALVALIVRLDSPGPVIIRQKRIGEYAQPFEMLKFRTMAQGGGAEERRSGGEGEEKNLQSPVFNPSGLHKRPDDPRVTRAGRVLRRYSLDELPQLVNVLRGEMSLVGPRPELPWLVDRYESWQRHRFAAPPGMTGWWQIRGRSDRPMHLNVEDDLYYIRNYSLWLDVVILLRTIPVVLSGKGAY